MFIAEPRYPPGFPRKSITKSFDPDLTNLFKAFSKSISEFLEKSKA
ncbi:MAG: hypothetical protein R3B65_04195 [Candidatus Paceibacterota bacterium]